MRNLVDRYLLKKKEDIIDYSKIINKFLKYNNNQLWKSNSEFNELLKSIVNYYVDNYYFAIHNDFSDYNNYFGPLIKCDDRFKTVLVCTIENVKPEYLEANKVSIYLISLIVYTAVIADRFTYPYSNYQVNMPNVESVIKPMFDNVSFVKFETNNDYLKEITKLIKKNNHIEKKFFKTLNILNNENSKNEYEPMDSNKKYYKAIYKYEIESLEGYTERELKKTFKRISDDLVMLSYNLASISALKILMMNKDINILFPIELSFFEKEIEISKLDAIVKNKSVKEKVKLLVTFKDFKENIKLANALMGIGFKIAINIEDAKELSYNSLADNKLFFVNEEFINVNKSNMEMWQNMEKEFNIKEKDVIISEIRMLGLKEE